MKRYVDGQGFALVPARRSGSYAGRSAWLGRAFRGAKGLHWRFLKVGCLQATGIGSGREASRNSCGWCRLRRGNQPNSQCPLICAELSAPRSLVGRPGQLRGPCQRAKRLLARPSSFLKNAVGLLFFTPPRRHRRRERVNISIVCTRVKWLWQKFLLNRAAGSEVVAVNVFTLIFTDLSTRDGDGVPLDTQPERGKSQLPLENLVAVNLTQGYAGGTVCVAVQQHCFPS
jgi:hypothetical protein